MNNSGKWYNKWGQRPVYYLLYHFLRVSLYIACFFLLKSAIHYIKGKDDYLKAFQPITLLVIFIFALPFLWHFRRHWHLNRIKYMLQQGIPLNAKERRRLSAYRSSYYRWNNYKWSSLLLNALFLPLIFLVIFCILMFFKHGRYEPGFFLDQFEPGVLQMLIAVFYGFGIWMGYAYTRQYFFPQVEELILLSSGQPEKLSG